MPCMIIIETSARGEGYRAQVAVGPKWAKSYSAEAAGRAGATARLQLMLRTATPYALDFIRADT